MEAPKCPKNEVKRLDLVKNLGILDSEQEERFDRITRLASNIFRVPISIVTIIDKNRQWFKSQVGLEVAETERDISFCGHAILEDDVFVVQDASKDPRFFDNPLVMGDPNICFYAGKPLVVHGEKVGTLCIIDTTPRKLSDSENEILKDLAAMVEAELTSIRLAIVDELTKTPNRRGFFKLTEMGLDFCKRQNQTSSLSYFDLNDFKRVNDSYGHAAGDEALICFSKCANQVKRDTDIFGRIGGDEFVLWQSNTTSESFNVFATRLNDLLQLTKLSFKAEYRLSFSSGTIEIPSSFSDSLEEMLAHADNVMFQEKRQKKI